MPPIILLIEPQLAENIGMVARAMANFALEELRIVVSPDQWPERRHMKKEAVQASSGAASLLENTQLFTDLRSALADIHKVYATTARSRDQMKQVFSAKEAILQINAHGGEEERTIIMFGRERSGLTNDEIALADAIISFPVNPAFSSLNLAQAVLLTGYEWYQAAVSASAPFHGEPRTLPATRKMLDSLFDYMESSLEEAGYYPPAKKPIMARNMRDILQRAELTEQDVRSLHGAFVALNEGRRTRAQKQPS
jgi:tRNA/rRNA methyltransferase